MKKLVIICIFLLSSCSTLTKDKWLGKNKTKETLAQQINETHLAERTLLMKDSSDATIEFTIWPKGDFRYAPEKGFEGEAFKVEFKGKQYRLIKSGDLSVSKKETTTQLKFQKEQVAKLKGKKVERIGMDYGIGFLLLLLILIGLWSFRKKLSSG